ncbi:solute carrier family 41 member 1 isoform X2 [Folsomia candida]|uniref:solute carrier family 41 member 1 isoform X2 n=1 Tax=Folsomia candida TaxID=158441 RepID=UPI001604BB0E|nr:solute carrier family 41 member 1 isoform X2 [Folsomia candida]
MVQALQLSLQRRDSVDSAIWTAKNDTMMTTTPPQNEQVCLDVSALPGYVTQPHQRRTSVGIVVVDVCNEPFVVESDDTEIVQDSPTPSCDDGISMNFSISSMGDEGRGTHGGVFVTESSASLPIYECNNSSPDPRSVSRSSVSLATSSICAGGGGDEKDPSRFGTPIHPSLGAGDSRASLISLGKRPVRKDETWISILSQIGLPFLIAGLGMVGAGLLLDYVMTWPVFIDIGELVILVTPLLGLKGNLEMTLAARLSTHSNIGNLDKATGKKWTICSGNLILDQLQAIVCGFSASLIAVTIGYTFTGKFDPDHMSLVVVSSVLTASMVSLILGSTMISVILISKKFKINPDNVDGFAWIPYVIIAFYLACLPVCFWLAFRNEYTRPVTISGWVPLLVSVLISTGGGILLDLASARFPGVALYQPVINGIGGNLVSVQASRISSYLHGHCEKRLLPDNSRVCETPFSVFMGKGINSMSARLLLLLAIPGHLLFSTVAHFVASNDDTNYGPVFLVIYVAAAVTQVTMLLYIAKVLTNLCWVRGIDPDTATIPYLTALGDLFGSSLLFVAFEVLLLCGQVATTQ